MQPNNNNRDIYSAVIVITAIARVHPFHFMSNPQTKPADLE